MVKVSIPATSANMGSGFDSIGVALSLYNVFFLEESDKIEILTDDDSIPTDKTNLVYKCVEKVYNMCGKELKGLKIIANCDIPQARGLGSSSACIAGGLIGANKMLGNPLTTEQLVNLACELEGHPDNSTPAILGGLCVGAMHESEVFYSKLPINQKIKFVAFIPNFELKTEVARGALPSEVSHKDAVFNLSRSALLTASLVEGDLHNIEVAIDDRLHQPYRFKIIEDGIKIADKIKSSGALGVYISGAGPTIMAIINSENSNFIDKARELCENKFPKWKPILLDIDQNGAIVEEM